MHQPAASLVTRSSATLESGRGSVPVALGGVQVSAWRRKALEAFPELHREINAKPYSVYWLFFTLLPRSRDAHVDHDADLLGRIYRYGEW
jgi:hypothetical protein